MMGVWLTVVLLLLLLQWNYFTLTNRSTIDPDLQMCQFKSTVLNCTGCFW